MIAFSTIEGVSVLHDPPGTTLPPNPPSLGRDWLRAGATSETYPLVSVWLRAPFGAAFSDDSLPTALDLADFPDAAVQGLVAAGLVPNPAIEDVGTITALWLVPEPDALALGAAAIATLALGGRARSRSSRPGATTTHT